MTETSLPHPADAIGADETETASCRDEHVEAVQQTVRIDSSGVVDQPLINNQSALSSQSIVNPNFSNGFNNRQTGARSAEPSSTAAN
jgi:hypothetical protein